MKLTFLSSLMSGLALVASPASAADDVFTKEFVERSFNALEVEYVLISPGDAPKWEVQFDDGFSIDVTGKLCSDLGCKGLSLYASWDDFEIDPADVDRYMSSYVFGRVYDDDGLMVHRYLIADGGISQGNLTENIRVFGELAPRVPMHIENLRNVSRASSSGD